MTKTEKKKLAQYLLERYMGYIVPLSRIIPLEFNDMGIGFSYLFKLSASEVTYLYRDNFLLGKSFLIFKDTDCVNGMYIYNECFSE